MAQHDYVIANASGLAVRQDINNALAAVVSNNSGSSAPSTTYAYMWWPDTTTGLLKQRNAANSAWITVGTLGSANLGLLPTSGGTLTGALLVDDSGTAALPAVAFDGDADTGIYRKAANEVGVATAGILRAWFDSAGVNLDAQGDTRYWDSDSSNYVAFQAPATVASNVTWTLPSADGTNGQALITNGSGVLSFGGVQMTLSTAVNTTSGTAIDFTGIPSWAKKITVMFNVVSTNGSSPPQVQLGYSGGIETTGYSGSNTIAASGVVTATFTSGFGLGVNTAQWSSSAVVSGSVVLTLLDAATNKWTAFGVLGGSDAAVSWLTSGSKSLSGTLDRLRLTTANGADTFDAGSVNIMYEG